VSCGPIGQTFPIVVFYPFTVCGVSNAVVEDSPLEVSRLAVSSAAAPAVVYQGGAGRPPSPSALPHCSRTHRLSNATGLAAGAPRPPGRDMAIPRLLLPLPLLAAQPPLLVSQMELPRLGLGVVRSHDLVVQRSLASCLNRIYSTLGLIEEDTGVAFLQKRVWRG